MKALLQWIRNFATRFVVDPITSTEESYYVRFENAVAIGDVEAYIYEEHGMKGQVVLLQGEDLHAVTPRNLVSFRKLNRRESRELRRKYSKLL